MKIQGPSETGKTSAAKKTGKAASASDGSFEDFVASGMQGTAPAAAAQSIARVDALLSVQAAEDPTERAARRRMVNRAEGLLEELEKIRAALLTGTLTLGHCVNIADVVASHRERVADSLLTGVLDEIDLRAQVEIAKMRRAMEAQTQQAQ